MTSRRVETSFNDFGAICVFWEMSTCTGEAQYADDLPAYPGQLYAEFVTSTQGNATIQSIDTTEAMTVQGVVKILTSSDIPSGAKNDVAPESLYNPIHEIEELFCSGQVKFYGQSIALVVAESQEAAMEAAKLVTVTYTNVQTPIVDIDSAIKAGNIVKKYIPDLVVGDPDKAITDAAHQITGSFHTPEQIHFYMETLAANCVPTEDGLDLVSTTQSPSTAQLAVRRVTGLHSSNVKIQVKRLGGAYGGKSSRNNIVAAACGLAAKVTNRPVRIRLPIKDNLLMCGRRFSHRFDYKVGFADNGQLLGIDIHIYEGLGITANENVSGFFYNIIDSAYHCPNWRIAADGLRLNTPCNTFTRGPITTPSVQAMEHIMEKIADTINGDAMAIKRSNLYQTGQVTPSRMVLSHCNIRAVTNEVMNTADVENRKAQCATFNKVAQIVAYKLGIPVDKVSIAPVDTLVSPNVAATGGSTTSEECCKGAAKCCDELIANMKPVKDKMTDPTWTQLVSKCYEKMVVLKAEYTVAGVPLDVRPQPFVYNSYGATCAEVELDVLTGEYQINRVDLVYDCGESLNPAVDIGQVEGAFMMGVGHNTTEEVAYDPTTGKMINYDTWGYHPPTNKDIPIDFRVSLLKNAPNPVGFLRSKASGEPPLNMGCAIFFALQNCIKEARKEVGRTGEFIFEPPATRDKVQELCLNDLSQFVISLQ
ncbi:hypothetical protein ACF0H5_016115 [Mactra antiquata]